MAHPTAVMIGTDAIAKMTAMLALVSRLKREINAVMRPAGMVMHLLVGAAGTDGILPWNHFPDCGENPFNFIDLGGAATPQLVPLGGEARAGTLAL